MDQSLLNRADNSADIDLSIVKVMSFMAVLVIAAGLAGYFIAQINLVYGLLSLFFFWILFVLQVFFIKDWSRIFITSFLEAAAMVMPSAIAFKDNFSGYVFLAFGVLFGAIVIIEQYGRKELGNSLKIPFMRAAKGVTARIIPVTFIFITIVYVFIGGQTIAAAKGQSATDLVVTPLIQKTVLPEFSSKMSLDDLIQVVAERQLGASAFQALPQYAKAAAVQKVKDAIFSYTGTIDSKAPLGQAIYKFFADRLTDSSLWVKASVGFALLTIIWFIVKTISLVLYLPVALLAGLFYEILIVMNFVAIQYESRSREIILLK